MSDELSDLRIQIDAVDEELLRLFNERARLAQRVGVVKNHSVIYRPEREAVVHQRLRELNQGPLDNQSISGIFTEVISACRALEEVFRVACLGPRGTYSEEACFKHFGRQIELHFCRSIEDIFRTIQTGEASFGVIPLENSTEGAINISLDLLFDRELYLIGEVGLPIHHNLMSKSDSRSISKIYAHSQSLAQCHAWITQNYPGIETVPVSSNAEAAIIASRESNAAAVASRAAADHYELNLLATNIEDKANNTTRFGVIARECPRPSGRDKTSIVMASQHTAGAIFELLEPLAKNGISMTRLESRPSRMGLWEYMFFVDFEGHKDEPLVEKALNEIMVKAGFLKVLGSYPRMAN